jgi:hypothetical protein
MGQGLVQLALIKKPFLGFHPPGMDNADLLSVRPIDTNDRTTASGHSEIEKARLNRKTRGIRQQPNRKGVFKRLLNLLARQGAFHPERRVVPIKFHKQCGISYNFSGLCRPHNVITMYLRVKMTLVNGKVKFFEKTYSGT